MLRGKYFPIALLLAFVGARPAAAQNGAIQGVVTDQTKAVVPGVKVTVTNTATGVSQIVDTNESGLYSVPFLLPGTYKVGASKPGFSPVAHGNLKLDVGQTARVDFVLAVGAVAQTVEVSAAATAIDSQTSTVGQVIDNKQIVELPLNGRNYLELAA